MRLYMQIPPSDAGSPKFYYLHLQEDLLDGWTLVRECGFQGAGGRMVKDHYVDKESAEKAMLVIRDAQLKKGYQVVFMQARS